MTPAIRYPSSPITPHGAYYFFKGTLPTIKLAAYDNSISIALMGGESIPDRFNAPECVQIEPDGLKGLVPPWKTIDQKGATQDGVSFIDALYDPIEVTIDAVCRGRDPQHVRKVVRDVIASVDPKQKSELSFLTKELGRWWANVRHYKTITNATSAGHPCRQKLKLVLRADDGFWRSYDDVAQFRFGYSGVVEKFDFTDPKALGPNWPQQYFGAGGGLCVSDGSGDARWYDDPARLIGTQGREVVNGPYKDFETATDNQVIEIELGSIQEISFPDSAENHIWGRMGRDAFGRWNGYGVKAQIGFGGVVLSRFNAFNETVMRAVPWPLLVMPPLPWERFALVCGYEGNARTFKLLRNGFEVFTHVETDNGSALGPDYRGVGFGMRAGAALLTQATPASVRHVSAGDNGSVTQSGFLKRVNVGDQPMWDRYTIFGPASVVKIGNGPNTTDTIEFGPVLPGQVVQIRTDPRKRGVVDLTSKPPTPQELKLFEQAQKDYASFATANNAPVLLQQLESAFGVVPPQANLYPYLKGRFNKPIPAKSPGNPAVPHYVSVSIDDGNADSKVIAAGTPLRRYPQ